MVRDRSWRRQHAFRLKSKRRFYRIAVTKTSITIGKIYQSHCACSCYLCGNKRKNHGEKMQERRAKLLHTD
ncbi:hypothetical protein FHU12_4966 [Serratia marcescens]|uniref:Uncharacterized protein n=1 Tax=Serratia marcescens TaxID=615 RepID=A0AA46K9S8_SERMA|nr:hypothetical protein FHU12_4966 [Serratia marcescens]